MKNFVKIIAILVLAASVYSAIPVLALYLESDSPAISNEEVLKVIGGGKGDHFKFIIIGDNHAGLPFNDSAFLKMIRRINREDRFKKAPIDFVEITGDITCRGAEWDYRAFNKLRPRIKWPVVVTIGNHDTDNNGEARFRQAIGDRELAFADRNSYFITLDNENGDLTDEQLQRFEDELKKSASYAHRFVFLHKSPISLYQQSWFRPELNSWAHPFMELCEKYKVDIVFSGHEHMYKEALYGGVRYITSGGGGMLIQFPERDGGYLHYVVVRVYGDYVDYEIRRVFPPLWEYLTYYMWKELMYTLKDTVL